MGNIKISTLSSSFSPNMDGVTLYVSGSETYKTSLAALRVALVDSGSHHFNGDLVAQKSLGVSGSLSISGSLCVTGSIHLAGDEHFIIGNNGVIVGQLGQTMDGGFNMWVSSSIPYLGLDYNDKNFIWLDNQTIGIGITDVSGSWYEWDFFKDGNFYIPNSGSILDQNSNPVFASLNNNNTFNGFTILSNVSSSLNFNNDIEAANGGVPLGGLYRSGSFVLIRLN